MELLHDDDEGWATAATLLEAGRVVAVPTDTVYGVAAAIRHPGAVARLFPLKARDLGKPVAVLVASIEQATELVDVSPLAHRLGDRCWPGALTLVLPRRTDFDVDLGGAGDTVGVRCPAHPGIVGLCARLGPLATTSANRSGRPTPPDAAGVSLELAGTEVAAVLDGGELGGLASTVVRVERDGFTVLREGPVSPAELAAVAATVA